MSKALEISALALLFLCTALLLVVQGTRFAVVFGIRLLLIVAVVVGTVGYLLGEIGVL